MGISNKYTWCRWTAILVLMVFAAGTFSGCTTLRRKFVRKSKSAEQKTDFIPVLEPVEYKAPVHTPGETYKTQYVMLKAYYADLWETLGRSDNVKRELYLMTEISAKIKAMAAVLKPPRQAELAQLAAKVDAGCAQLDKPRGLRRYDLLRSDMKSVETMVFRFFKPALAEKDLAASLADGAHETSGR